MTSGQPQPSPARQPRARRPRGPLALLPLLVAAWALLEIWLLLLVGDAAGGATVLLLLLAGLVLGSLVIKRTGRRAWQQLTETLQAGRAAPAEQRRARGGNGLTMLGGLLLMVPGLASDVLGLLCVFPPTAALLRRAGARWVTRRSGPLGVAFQDARAAHEQMRMRRDGDRVVQGEVIRDDEEPPGRPGGSAPEDGGPERRPERP
ncbi:FxsA family membrane protein [Streptomyces marincola]|uniref:FxsA family membrane protein n=1 Tax=Streptomyces marincola TaxID=2878388 RepID=UPI001CF4788C|nr:FxsA family membrane protein [Streptomyces marincola]UCM86754.1 FxsA family protein [Streptomyces marincola]